MSGPVEQLNDPRFGEMKVLIIDESQHMISVIADLLRRYGFSEIAHAHDPDEADRMLKRTRYGLILCDLLTGDRNGVDLVSTIRHEAAGTNRTTPVVFMTAQADRMTIFGARDASANEIIRKPFTASQLFKKIKSILDHPRDFVASKTFTGPDRRRRDVPELPAGERRQEAPKVIQMDSE